MSPKFSPDGVHPNAAGYAAMQPLASAVIERALKERAESANSPVFRLPPSSLLSETVSASSDHRNDLIRDEAIAVGACPSLQGAMDVPAIRRCQAEAFYKTPFYQRAQERYRVSVKPQEIGGVYTEIFTPEGGVAAENRNRVLINLHGGAFDHGARYIGRLESMPVAATGRIKVIAIDYRMAPEHVFPAAGEDVVAVYRELLKSYRPQDIGIYGCSAGGLLVAQTVAVLQKENLPRPAAVGMFCEGGSFWTEGDSGALDALMWNQPVEPSRAMAYLKNADPRDPLAFPASSAQVMAGFPPALLISGTRDFALSSVVHTHSILVAQHVEADLHVWEGMEHSFFLDPDLPQTAEAYSVIAGFFDKHLGKH